jgi:transcriptional regulator with XRE-family HTH domain
MTWGNYVSQLADGENQKAIAARLGVDQGTVSRWLRGESSPKNTAVVAHVAQVYGSNVLEAFVAAGMLSPEEAGMPPQPRLDFDSIVDADPSLSSEAKAHLKSEYVLLQAASAYSRALTA